MEPHQSETHTRRYIRAACAEIRNATRAARTKRDEFYETLLNGLLPELTGQPPQSRSAAGGGRVQQGSGSESKGSDRQYGTESGNKGPGARDRTGSDSKGPGRDWEQGAGTDSKGPGRDWEQGAGSDSTEPDQEG